MVARSGGWDLIAEEPEAVEEPSEDIARFSRFWLRAFNHCYRLARLRRGWGALGEFLKEYKQQRIAINAQIDRESAGR